MATSVRISPETHKHLLKISGDMQADSEEKVTMEKAIVKLMEYWNGKGGEKK